jgi:hypothetical protein
MPYATLIGVGVRQPLQTVYSNMEDCTYLERLSISAVKKPIGTTRLLRPNPVAKGAALVVYQCAKDNERPQKY